MKRYDCSPQESRAIFELPGNQQRRLDGLPLTGSSPLASSRAPRRVVGRQQPPPVRRNGDSLSHGSINPAQHLRSPRGKPVELHLKTTQHAISPLSGGSGDPVAVDLYTQAGLLRQRHRTISRHHGCIGHDGEAMQVASDRWVVQQLEVRRVRPGCDQM